MSDGLATPRRRWRVRDALCVTLFALGASAYGQQAPSLALPVDCDFGKSCIIQNYVDNDPGTAARDYRCGTLTYDGHKGTDIRVIGTRALESTVEVVAAAPGRVRAVRDDVPDVSARVAGKAAVAGREAGNAVVVEHGGGWETQYSHLRKSSVAVRAGDVVRAGQRLGVVGLSGNTEFPHLHLDVRHNGKPVDPFVGIGEARPCSVGTRTLWQPQALAALPYVATGVVDAGISGARPPVSASVVDPSERDAFTLQSGMVLFWVQIYGAQAKDTEELRVFGPGGEMLVDHRAVIPRKLAQWIAYGGRLRKAPNWQPGVYRGEYRLYRDASADPVLSVVREVTLIERAPRGDATP